MSAYLENISNYLFQLEKVHQKKTAITYMLIAQLCFTFMYTAVGFFRQEYTTIQILYFRMAIGFFLNYRFCHIKQLNVYVPEKKASFLLLIRGLLGASSMILMFLSLGLMNISDSVIIQNLTPIWTNILAIIYLGEHFSRKAIICFIFGFCGVMLMSRPEFIFHDSEGLEEDQDVVDKKQTQFLGTLIGFSGSVSAAVMTIVIKKLTTQYKCHNVIQQQYSYIVTFFVTGIMLVVYNQGDYLCSMKFFIFSIVNAFIGLVGQLLFSRAYGLEKTSIIAPITYFQSFLVFILDVFLLGTQVEITSVIASILIIIGSLGVIL